MKKIYLLPLMLLFQMTFAMNAMKQDAQKTESRDNIIDEIAGSNAIFKREEITALLASEKSAAFLQVKKILSITAAIREMLHESYGSILRQDTRSELDYSPDCRTQEGYILFCGLSRHSLATPWGLIKIHNGGVFYDGTEHLPTCALFQRLGVKFIQCTQAQQSTDEGAYEVISPTFDTKKGRFKAVKIQLTHEDLQAEAGSSKIILGKSDERDSVYEITAIDSEPCPKAANLNSDGKKRDILAVREEWKTLEKLAASGLLN